MQDKISLDLFGTAFARQGSRPVLVKMDDGYYLGLKPAGEALPFAQVFGGVKTKGVFRIQFFEDGKEIPYTVNAEAFLTEFVSEKGTVRFALDKTANAMRIEGNVPQFRLSSPSTGANSIKYTDGVETNLGGRVIHKVRRGTFEFDDSWMLTRWSSVPPCLDIKPVDGSFDIACIELPADTDAPEVTKTFEECVEENKADFEAFRKTLKPTDGLTAYRLWSDPPKAGSAELAGESFMFTDAKAVFDRVLASAKAGKSGIVPLFAAAALRMCDEKLIGDIAEGDVKALAGALKAALDWWNTYRFDAVKGMYFYAYRSETGEQNPQWFTEAPVYALPLQERLSQLKTAVQKLS